MARIREREHAPPLPASSLRNVLVAVDGSPEAEAGLAAAAEIARRGTAALHVARVVVPIPNQGMEPLEQLQAVERNEARRYVELSAERIHANARIPASAVLADGSPVGAICEEAARLGADLLVLTTHGHTGLKRAAMGSVADGVARHATVPVLLLRSGMTRPEGAPPISRLLVALDGSPEAEHVLPAAVALAIACGARLELLQVVPPVMVPLVDMPLAPPVSVEDTDLTRRQIAAASQYLSALAGRLRGAGLGTVHFKAIASGAVQRAILDEARATGADAVALTSHGRGASRLVFGSVADAILRQSTAALLLVRVPR